VRSDGVAWAFTWKDRNLHIIGKTIIYKVSCFILVQHVVGKHFDGGGMDGGIDAKET
jgi:hypothetical protein